MQTYTYNLDSFPLLTMQELDPGKSLIGQGVLSPSEFEQFEALIAFLPPMEALNTQEVLLVQADSGGVLERVYAPALFATEEGSIVLRVGANTWPVTPAKGYFHVGSLTGFLNVEMKENFRKEQYMLVSVNFSDEADTASFSIGVRILPESEVTQVQLQKLVAKGDSIAAHLMVAGKGGTGGTVMKMHELGIGEFRLVSVEQVEITKDGEQPRTSWILGVDSGDRVWAKSGIIVLLKDGGWIKSCVKLAKATMQDTKGGFLVDLAIPFTLKISKIEKAGDGFAVNCQILEREPRGVAALPGVSVGVAAIAPVTPQSELVGNAPSGSFEDMPF